MKSNLQRACGVDVHKNSIEACIMVDKGYEEPEIIREQFTTLLGDLKRLREWIIGNDCLNVAMESTGIYWLPLYEILEEVAGINLCLVNSYHMKNLPGRKSDVRDAEWIAELFIHGLLNKSFVPEKDIRDLREQARFYKAVDRDRVTIVNRLEKFLQRHGFKLSSVLSNINGVSSKNILEKLCEQGEISVEDIKACLVGNVKKPAEVILYAINGKLSDISKKMLRQHLNLLYSHEKELQEIKKKLEDCAKKYTTQINLLTTIPGISSLSATYIISEIGIDMSRFLVRENCPHQESRLISWAGLAPRNDVSAGIIKSKKINKGNAYLKPILIQCAWALVKNRKSRPSNWYWHNVGRLGQKVAIVGVARRLLTYVFHVLKTGEVYNDELDRINTDRNNAIKLVSVTKRLSKLVYESQQRNISIKNVSISGKNKKSPKKLATELTEKTVQDKKSPSNNPFLSDRFDIALPKKRAVPKKYLQSL